MNQSLTKICTECGKELPATLEYFYKCVDTKDGLQSWCKTCIKKAAKQFAHTEGRKKIQQKYDQSKLGKCRNQKYYQQHKEAFQKRGQKYYSTIKGHLIHVFHNIKQRCGDCCRKDFKNYGSRGIKCEFTCTELLDWCIKNCIDPRGKQIHRINNDGHYELGNIEFLTLKEHCLKHRRIG